MATLFVDKIDPQSGTSLEIGSSGDTVTIPSGCTLTNSGTATGFGGITMADQWRWTADFTGNAQPIANNWERNDTSFAKIGTGMTESSGVFTFPQTGIYKIDAWTALSLNSNSRYNEFVLRLSTNGGSSYSSNALTYTHISNNAGDTTYSGIALNSIIDVTDTTNFKVALNITHADTNTRVRGDTSTSQNAFTFIRLGDT